MAPLQALSSGSYLKNKIQAECLCLAPLLPLRGQDGGRWVRKVYIIAHSTFLPLFAEHPGPVSTLLFTAIDIGTPSLLKLTEGYWNTARDCVSTFASVTSLDIF